MTHKKKIRPLCFKLAVTIQSGTQVRMYMDG